MGRRSIRHCKRCNVDFRRQKGQRGDFCSTCCQSLLLAADNFSRLEPFGDIFSLWSPGYSHPHYLHKCQDCSSVLDPVLHEDITIVDRCFDCQWKKRSITLLLCSKTLNINFPKDIRNILIQMMHWRKMI